MRSTTHNLRTLLLLALAAAACHTPSAPELAFEHRATGIKARDFPAPAHMLRGVSPRDPEAPWRVGDEVLYGLQLKRGDSVRHWLLQLRLLEIEATDERGKPVPDVTWELSINGEMQSFASAICRAEVVVMDEHGKELGRSTPQLPRDFLNRGIASACQLARSQAEELGQREHSVAVPEVGQSVYSDDNSRPLAEATVTAVALLQIVQEDSVLAPLLWQVIEKPSAWSVITGLGVHVLIRPRFHRVTSALSPVPSVRDETWRLPIALEVNDTKALNLDLFVTNPTPPFALAGGMLGATARHPTDPTREFSLLLLSAKVGTVSDQKTTCSPADPQ